MCFIVPYFFFKDRSQSLEYIFFGSADKYKIESENYEKKNRRPKVGILQYRSVKRTLICET